MGISEEGLNPTAPGAPNMLFTEQLNQTEYHIYINILSNFDLVATFCEIIWLFQVCVRSFYNQMGCPGGLRD